MEKYDPKHVSCVGPLAIISSSLLFEARLFPALHHISHSFVYPSLENFQGQVFAQPLWVTSESGGAASLPLFTRRMEHS